jgi:hypothetical protein
MRRTAVAALGALLAAATILTIAEGFAANGFVRVLQGLAIFACGVVVVVGATVLVILRLAGWRESEEEFDRLVAQAESLSVDDASPTPMPQGADADVRRRAFDADLRRVLDGLPVSQHRALEWVDIVVTHSAAGHRGGRGRRLGPYGSFRSDGAQGHFSQWILLFRERLERDFGDDRELLRLQLHNMLSHELERLLAAAGDTPSSERGARGGL